MPDPIRLLVADGAATKFAPRIRKGAAAGFDLIVPDTDAEAALVAAAPAADAILAYQARVSAAVIAAAPKLRLIQKHGMNCRNIDLAAARARGIPVATVPLMRNVTVAEHAMALLLACARKVVPGHKAVTGAVYRELGLTPETTAQRQYSPNWAQVAGVTELFMATVGIVGMGDIGMEIAKRCRAFGMTVLYHQRTPHDAATEHELGIAYAGLDDLVARADYVVLVIPHTPETEGLIGPAQFARMKPTATLVNVGRGGLVDEDALAAALRDGRLAMAGLDVYRREPLPADSPLLGLPNVVLLPHTGGGSYRSWEIDVPAVLASIRGHFGPRAEPR